MKKIYITLIFTLFALNIHTQNKSINDSIMKILDRSIEETPYAKPMQLELNDEDITRAVDSWTAFGVFKDTYFATGIPMNQSINRHTADALFQISIRHRFTKSRLPFNTFLYLTYTQKSFWDIYAESAPFRDNNYNPALGLGKYIIKDNKLRGTMFIQLEHESNGRDGKESRSWNMLSASMKYFYNPRLILGVKLWFPFVDGDENEDLLDYRGIGTVSANYITKNKRWWFTVDLNPRKGFGNINTTLTAAFKVAKNDNQFLYARFFNGKGDSLLDYSKYELNIRIGICIKPDFSSVF